MIKNKNLILGTFIILALNMGWAGIAWGQSSNQSSVSVNRTGSLSFFAIPSSLDFGTLGSPGVRTPTFSDSLVDGIEIVNLPANKLISVLDTRGQGGFNVTLSANGNFSDGGTNTITVSNASPNDNLRIVTTSRLGGVTGTIAGGAIYENGFVGPQTVSMPVNTAATNFGLEATFTGVASNALDTAVPLVVFDGTLASTTGRIGKIDAGVSSMLYIPAYQGSGQYTTTLTWTLTDSTI